MHLVLIRVGRMVDQMVFFRSGKQWFSPARPVRESLIGPAGWWLFVLVPLFAGCGGDGKPPLHPVEGKVFVDKKPAHRAVVWLHPVTPESKRPPLPHAQVAEDGSFRLGTYRIGDGAAPGKYRVIITWTEAVKSGDVAGKNLLPARYQSLENSGLPVVEIKEGTNELPPFHLTR